MKTNEKGYLLDNNIFFLAIYIFIMLFEQVLLVTGRSGLLLTLIIRIFKNILVFLMIFFQRKELSKNNISMLTIVLLLLFGTESIIQDISNSIRTFYSLVNFMVVVLFLVVFIKSKDKKIPKCSSSQYLFFIAGLLLGLVIAIIKIKINHSELLYLAVQNPRFFLYGLFFSFSFLSDEIIFRGMVWGILRTKGINDFWIILISTLLWVSTNFSLFNQIPELINFIYLGLLFGVLVKATKSVDISIGAYAGYSSFLIMSAVFFS